MPGADAFGADVAASAFAQTREVLPQRGMTAAPGSRTDATAGHWGSMIGTFGPLYGTLRSW